MTLWLMYQWVMHSMNGSHPLPWPQSLIQLHGGWQWRRQAIHLLGCHLISCQYQASHLYSIAQVACWKLVATSTDVERAFSRGGLTVSKMCHSLSNESVCAAMVLGSWCQFPDAIPWDEIEVAFRDKSKCPKAKESIASTSDMIQVDSD